MFQTEPDPSLPPSLSLRRTPEDNQASHPGERQTQNTQNERTPDVPSLVFVLERTSRVNEQPSDRVPEKPLPVPVCLSNPYPPYSCVRPGLGVVGVGLRMSDIPTMVVFSLRFLVLNCERDRKDVTRTASDHLEGCLPAPL